MEKTYAERADSATTFDPELQFDRDVEREQRQIMSELTDHERSNTASK